MRSPGEIWEVKDLEAGMETSLLSPFYVVISCCLHSRDLNLGLSASCGATHGPQAHTTLK